MDDLDILLDTCRTAVRSVDADAREELVSGILSHRKVFVYGSGRSGLVGQMFAVRLVQLGLDVHFVGEMTTPIIGKEDLTLLISYTGRTSSVVQTAEIARRIGSEIFCITGTSGSPLTRVSDVSLVMSVPEGEGLHRVAPLGTVFEDSALLLFDGIVSEIMSREGISEDDMRRRHAIWVRSHSETSAEAVLHPSPSTMYTASSPAYGSMTTRIPSPIVERRRSHMASLGSVPSEGKYIPTSGTPAPSTLANLPFASESHPPLSPPCAWDRSAASTIEVMALAPNKTSALVPILPLLSVIRRRPGRPVISNRLLLERIREHLHEIPLRDAAAGETVGLQERVAVPQDDVSAAPCLRYRLHYLPDPVGRIHVHPDGRVALPVQQCEPHSHLLPPSGIDGWPAPAYNPTSHILSNSE